MRLFHWIPLLLLAVPACAQNASHWGVQADYFQGQIPQGIIDHIQEFPEHPSTDGRLRSAGLVRFHATGAPSWSLDYSETNLTFSGNLSNSLSLLSQTLVGRADVRGGMVTKYLNFVNTRFVSAGLAFGGGAGQVDANYYRYNTPPGNSVRFDQTNETRIVPVFQGIVQLDLRPVRWISIAPFYGMRNGLLGGGGAIRIHFVR